MKTKKMFLKLKKIYLIAVLIIFGSFTAYGATPSGCVDSCVIKVVFERQFYSGGIVSNLYYSYVPSGLWSSKSCISGLFAEDIGREPTNHDEPAYLVGWIKAFYLGNTWVTFGGDPGKYFLNQVTPFHHEADIVIAFPDQIERHSIINKLNELLPDGCTDLCPNNLNKTDPGKCGCSKPDTDSDGDGIPDCTADTNKGPTKECP